MLSHLFDLELHQFGPTAPCRQEWYDGFTERTEDLGNGFSILFQISPSGKRRFITFCTGDIEHCYVAFSPDNDDFSYHTGSSDQYSDEGTKERLFLTLESLSDKFVEWFLWNLVGSD